MCGVVGAIGYIDESLIQTIHKMNDAQYHRGPDGSGIWRKPVEHLQSSVIFGHRRLAIIDLSQDGAQPMLDRGTGNCITFNGEIYNYLTLRAELADLGEVFKTKTDTEVILVAYRRWGMAFINRLRGMYAFVLWDESKQEAVFCRDRMGIKPLYFYQTDGELKTVIFSSEVKTLIGSGLVPRRLDPVSLQSYIWNGFVAAADATIIKNVKQILPGSIMRVAADGAILSQHKYWQLGESHNSRTTKHDVEESLNEAIGLHLLSDVPVGVFLSGGIDSSAVATVASEQASTTVSTYTLVFDEADYDESRYARIVANSLGTHHHEIRLTQKEFGANLHAAISSCDQPTFDGVNTYFISKAIKQAGITVALAGTGGDELFGGYTSFKDVPRLTQIGKLMARLPSTMTSIAGNLITRALELRYGKVPPQTRWGKLGDLTRLRGEDLESYQTSYALFTQDFYHRLIAETSTQTKFGLERQLYDGLQATICGKSKLSAISVLELSLFLSQRLLRDTDSASMAASLEVRVPFLDHEFIEMVMGLSDDQRYLPLGRKQLLRDIASRHVEPKIFDRPKSGFVLPFDLWCKDMLKDEIEALVCDPGACEQVGLDSLVVKNLITAFNAKKPGLYWSRIWSLYVLVSWCQSNNVSLH
ncbi:asparagine synthase (glutamine-hydrolyzing) [Methylophaga sp. OBS4]|uniref:asparagine synthase (glutamine-hydrolyzing) n=1 Tax=Methylophaga sp. OBS4 TaxID=2991935 RepID=UPI00225B274A|nr:asparagine synthase (glutamine-hydrolyzing) [Methylophaga sp. OBS4]MCX4188421.1 asparagine synthase (glutamine-hydrolyzing) [Methylophaga sp. OBS4]